MKSWIQLKTNIYKIIISIGWKGGRRNTLTLKISCQIFHFKIIKWWKVGGRSLMPCPFTGRKMFCAGPNVLCQTKNLFTYCASHNHFVPDKKMICIQWNWFLCWTKAFEEALNAINFLEWLKTFGPAQNILEPVKGQGITCLQYRFYYFSFVMQWKGLQHQTDLATICFKIHLNSSYYVKV